MKPQTQILTARQGSIIYTVESDEPGSYLASSERPGTTSRVLLKFHGNHTSLADAKQAAQQDAGNDLIWS